MEQMNFQEIAFTLKQWIEGMTLEQGYTIFVAICACIYIVRICTHKQKKKTKYHEQWNYEGKETGVPEDYYWDPIDCQWYSPEDPRHPKNKQ